ncbi:SpoIIE family protein phosphatase [Actinoallomurus purpureus]|uniref:SpoIIE family protein phosphatase n=1 Tax=Actinoallomurus purpureus TaxID=478114 RepID=UPI00209324DA|nr:SpoIIE family protein phosphatase [Actinoallomurus purpureus]MCO6005618.1 SpoIIE family protein phosphatase [Actinoallomurus purpureus]
MADSSARTLVLGIGRAGEVLQCGQNSTGVLGRPPEEVVGTDVTGLFTEESKEALTGLLDALAERHERTAVLGVRTEDGEPRNAVVTVQPMHTAAADPADLMMVRVAVTDLERFTDPALMRRAMLDDALVRIGATLDLDQMARELVDVVVPHFCNAAGVLIQESIVAADEHPSIAADGTTVLRRVALATDASDPKWNAAFPTGEVLTYPPDTPYTRCMATGEPVLESHFDVKAAKRIARLWRRKPVAKLLADSSMVLLPLIARGTTLGFVVCTRSAAHRAFDAYDVEIGMEFAARAALYIDNARHYSRERATALTLQRSMLPTELTAPSSVAVRHRYLPGNQLIEVGGDWYESIALPGGRVALIVGDVAGHGVRAAVTMGRLRTALRTIVNLELSPADGLQQLDALMRELGEREPAFATCVYAVYDATDGTCEIASAGHLPPLLLRPNGTTEFLDVPPAPPLGVGEGMIETRTFTIGDGSILVLYTDGLVENRGQDIDDGLSRLRGLFGADALFRPLEELAKATLDSAYSDHDRDDIAVLIARLRRLPECDIASWRLPARPTAVRDARARVRETLERWDCGDLSFSTELVVSELVTNALRYASGDIELRLLRDTTLVCEVRDDSDALPRARQAADDDEGGRGLQVVHRLAKRWGARPVGDGKVVWCELELPGRDDAVEGAWPGEAHHLP